MCVFINTCLFSEGNLKLAKDYIDLFGSDIAFEILAKFNQETMAEEFDECLPVLKSNRIAFHEPAWMADHGSPKGSPMYEQTMRMIRQTEKYARMYNSEHLVYHLNNCSFEPDEKNSIIEIALTNLDEIREIFDFTPIYVENTGTPVQHNALLTQEEFTGLAKSEDWDVLLDIGHAHANGWDLYRFLDDMYDRICGIHIHNNDGINDLHNRFTDGTFDMIPFLEEVNKAAPDAKWVLEYCDPKYVGTPLTEDLKLLLDIKNRS